MRVDSPPIFYGISVWRVPEHDPSKFQHMGSSDGLQGTTPRRNICYKCCICESHAISGLNRIILFVITKSGNENRGGARNYTNNYPLYLHLVMVMNVH